MAKKYVLDLSKAELPSWWPKDGPVILPVVVGVHEYDWDLIPWELPKPFYAKLVKVISKKMSDMGVRFRTDLPIGFRKSSIPPGGVVREA